MTQRTEIENENSNEYMGGWLNNNEIEPTSQYEVDDEAELNCRLNTRPYVLLARMKAAKMGSH